MARFDLFLFGQPRLEREGEPVTAGRRKVTALLAFLAYTRQAHSREALATLLWPEHDQSGALAGLRRDLARLRKLLDGETVVATRQQVGLEPGALLAVDTSAFREKLALVASHDHFPQQPCAECLDALTTAVALYRGDFMAGFSLPDSPEFDEWQFFERESLRLQASDAFHRLIHWHETRHEMEQALAFASGRLALDPLHEPAQRDVIRLYALSGQYAAALRQYDECVRVLRAELGVAPEPETETLIALIRQRKLLPPERPEPPAAVEESPPPVRLPLEMTPFVGREQELADIRALLVDDPACRLLTLLGPGGIGKTRLGSQAARVVAGAFADGVTFVPLAAESAATYLATAVAEALAIGLTGGEPAETQVVRFLSDKRLLLLLDNFEHLLTGVFFLSDLLAAAPGVKLLVTSRERLNLQEEWTYELRGLPVPEPYDADDAGAEAALRDNSAVKLFMQAARRTNVRFEPRAVDWPAMVTICRLVAGMPLAIELAAGWANTLTPPEIAEELAADIDLLESALHDVPDRHRSLRIVFDQSWAQLTPGQQAVFARLACFVGGFSPAAAREVAGASLPMLSTLFSKSLLFRMSGERYGVHELLRQYARARLDETPDQALETRDKHSRYFATLLQSLEDDFVGERQRAALQAMDFEVENVRLGWQWAFERLWSDPTWMQIVDQYQGSLFHYYDTRSRYQEGEGLFSAAVVQLERQIGANPADKQARIVAGKLAARQAWFAFHLGRQETARAQLRASSAQLLALGAEAEAVFALNYLGAVSRHLGDYAAAGQHLQDALRISRSVGDRYGASVSLNILGQIAFLQGAYDVARSYCEESLAIKRELGDRWGMTFSLTYLGTVAQAQGAFEEARAFFSESLAISDQLSDRRGMATSLANLGDVAAASHDTAAARSHYVNSLGMFTRINNVLGMLATRVKLGTLAIDEGEAETAWSQFGIALELAQTLQVTPLVLEALVGIARLYQDEGRSADSQELLLLAAVHPVTSEETRQLALERLRAVGAAEPDSTTTPESPELDRQVAGQMRRILQERPQLSGA